ncbi:hypothetical protein [Actinomadura atramentaria]|uniref:hypothetical protein n=1 Tax=Actinomadura atramentaria TaxID=1990 RepID=UPI0003601E52|nr:hypothetical protein [Actinomadura atramentaria]
MPIPEKAATIQETERVRFPGARRFLREYAAEARPAIFAGPPARTAALDRLGGLDLLLGRADPEGSDPEHLRATLRGYLAGAGAGFRCLWRPIPPELRGVAGPPVRFRGGERRFRVGRKGEVSALHFDAELRGVLLHQASGTARVRWVPPGRSPDVDPFLNVGRAAGPFPDESAGELGPGDTAFVPTGWWHRVEHFGDGLAVRVRLPRNALNRALGGRVHTTWRAAGIAASAPGPAALTAVDRADLARVRAVLAAPGAPGDRLAAMDALVRELHARRCGGPDLPPDPAEAEVWRALADSGVLYAPIRGRTG